MVRRPTLSHPFALGQAVRVKDDVTAMATYNYFPGDDEAADREAQYQPQGPLSAYAGKIGNVIQIAPGADFAYTVEFDAPELYVKIARFGEVELEAVEEPTHVQ